MLKLWLAVELLSSETAFESAQGHFHVNELKHKIKVKDKEGLVKDIQAVNTGFDLTLSGWSVLFCSQRLCFLFFGLVTVRLKVKTTFSQKPNTMACGPWPQLLAVLWALLFQ